MRTFTILKRPASERDIEDCFVYIAEDNLDAGISFLVAVEETLGQLSKMPLMGRTVDFDNRVLSGIRMWPVKGFDSYLLFYRVDSTAVELIRLIHGARDIAALLD
jgi:toxin ParE1/3/4